MEMQRRGSETLMKGSEKGGEPARKGSAVPPRLEHRPAEAVRQRVWHQLPLKTARQRQCLSRGGSGNPGQGRCLSREGSGSTRKGSVLAAAGVETRDKGGALAAKAVEAQGKAVS